MEENKGRDINPRGIVSNEINMNALRITEIICDEIKWYLERHVYENVSYEVVREHMYYNLTKTDGKGYKEEAKASLEICLIVDNVRGMRINFNLMNAPKEKEIAKRIQLELEYIRTKQHMETLQEQRKTYESERIRNS